MKTIYKLLCFLFIITFLGCTEENNYYTTIENLGKVNVYIEGDITNEQAVEKLKKEIGINTENIYIQNTTQLTEIDVQTLGNIRDIVVKNNEALASITLNGKTSFANYIGIEENTKLATININKFVEVNDLTIIGIVYGGSDIICNDLTSLNYGLWLFLNGEIPHNVSFPNLKKIKSINKSVEYKYSQINGKYDLFNFPVLEEIGYISVYASKNSITFPKLKMIKGFYNQYNVNFETLNLPVLERCNTFDIRDDNNHNLNINIPILKYCEIFAIERTSMGSSKINDLLHQFINVEPLDKKRIYLSGQSPPAPPTGNGVTDKTTLINLGNTVETD